MCSCNKAPVKQQSFARSFQIPLIQGSGKPIRVGIGEPLLLDKQLVRSGNGVEMSISTYDFLIDKKVNVWKIF